VIYPSFSKGGKMSSGYLTDEEVSQIIDQDTGMYLDPKQCRVHAVWVERDVRGTGKKTKSIVGMTIEPRSAEEKEVKGNGR
jgi:hypothetical protein